MIGMRYSITFLESQYEQLLSFVFAKSGLEGAAYLLCGLSRTEEENRLLVREVIPVNDEHYLKRSRSSLSICSDSYAPVAKWAHELNQSILFVHSHPRTTPGFSRQDDKEELRLMEFFGKRAPEGVHGAAVITSPDSVLARITRGRRSQKVFRVRVIGRTFRFLHANTAPESSLPDFFDRQVRAFGPAIQRLLAGLHLGIVGVGGTGSAVVEQLVRLGVGELSIFDHDVLDDSNVNRVYGSGTGDAGRPKVDIANASAGRIGLGTIIHRFPKGISSERSARALRNCDAIFSCTDKHTPRAILTQLSIRYLIPFFDMGAKIESTGGKIKGIYGRATTFFPGEACLFCRNRISPEIIRLEGLNSEERQAFAREGYAPELETNAPAVIMFTTAVATQAVCEFLHRLTGYMGAERDTTEVLFRFHDTAVGRNRAKPDENCVCSQKKLWGRGDSRYFLDLSWPSEPSDPHPPT
jgi:molybdopterin/thiamine biosynthesis adenylyltransferase